ncbi:MAG: SDR family NAD(P)-dependent oxidoreductase [Clostridia bacterium]|nr:SDR family NAD(P)-dependent oxidoreductase [Clostridia bacterium]
MKVCIITGASAGMGKEFALQLKGRYGIEEFWLISRSEDKLKKVAAELAVPSKIIAADLASQGGTEKLDTALKENKPEIAVLVNGAGYGVMQSIEKSSYEDNAGMIDLNAKAMFTVTYLCLPYMKKGSQIVNICSFSSFAPIPYMSIYAASKAFALSFTRSLNTELKPRGIHALGFCPMWVKTEFFDRANKDKVVNNYPHPYEAAWVVKKCINAMNGKKDYVVPGIYAKINHMLTKIMPHSLVMKTFLKQQNIKQS